MESMLTFLVYFLGIAMCVLAIAAVIGVMLIIGVCFWEDMKERREGRK